MSPDARLTIAIPGWASAGSESQHTGPQQFLGGYLNQPLI